MNPGRLAKLGLVFWLAVAGSQSLRANGLVREIPAGDFRLERVAVPGGAQLITLFGHGTGSETEGERQNEIPILSVLRDTLGDSDPTNDRLRQVWVYSYVNPSLWQKVAAGLPFFYLSAHKNRAPAGELPGPLLDLGNPRKDTWRSLTEVVLQSEVLDGIGMPLKLTTRSFRGNAGDYRKLHLWQAATALSAAESAYNQRASTNAMEFPVLGARLALATRTLGGLVSERYLEVAWQRLSHESNLNRGHNWELLRQKAEDNGLRFQPLSLAGQENNFALLWLEQPLPAEAAAGKFDGKFLGISNPYKDGSSCGQDIYERSFYLNAQGNEVAEGTPGARPATMKPLALYALDYPRVPLLLVDFCNPHRPGTGERIRRFATDLTVNVLGWTTFSNWQYMVAKSSFMFVRRRHGAALDRSARMRAYAQLRYALKFDSSLDPDLRRTLEHNLQGLGLNPLSVGLGSEIEMARLQYAALLEYAESSNGLARKLQEDRAHEIAGLQHSCGARILFGLARIGTLGLYHHGHDDGEEGWEALDLQRRFAYQKRFLESILASDPRPQAAWDHEAVIRSVDILSDLGSQGPKVRKRAVKLLSTVMRETDDNWLRCQCAEGLQRLDAAHPTTLASLHGVPPANAETASEISGDPLTGGK
jgi:hypothetical protein